MSRCDQCKCGPVTRIVPDVDHRALCIECLALASVDLVDDLRAEIARLNAKIKRREVDLRVSHEKRRSDPSRHYHKSVRLAAHYRAARDPHYACEYLRAARALRLSDPSFAGRLP